MPGTVRPVRPAIVVGSYTPGLAVIRALGQRGVPVVVARYDDRDMGYASKWACDVVRCPHPEYDQTRFLDVLRTLAGRYPGALLVPTSDQAMLVVSANKDLLVGLGFVVAAPEEKVVRDCVNKADTYALADISDVAVPFTTSVSGADDIERYAARATFPAVLKPVTSHRYYAVFGRKWTRVDSGAEAFRQYELAAAAGLDVILQELIPGDELCGANYNGYFWGGEPLVEFTAAKIRNSPAVTGSPCVVVSRHLPDVLEAGRRMLRALDFHGFANVELKRDPRDGLYKLIEVNARHNLSAMLALRCGINFPWLQYRHLMDDELPEQSGYPQDVYWVDITRDLKESVGYLRRSDYSLRRFVRPYLAPNVYAVWSADDPRPAGLRARDIVRTLGRKISGPASAREPRRSGLNT